MFNLNEKVNIIDINFGFNKGLSNEEKAFNYYSKIKAVGNGAVLYDKNEKIVAP